MAACAGRVHARYAEHQAGQFSHAKLVWRLVPVRQQVHRLLVNAADHAPSERAARECAQPLKGEHKLWTFLDHEGVPPTNNQGLP